jgi:membrane associated rhomboid family serine protease
MFMMIPYRVETEARVTPLSNMGLIGLCVFSFLLLSVDRPPGRAMVLDGWGAEGLFGYMLLHGSWSHLIGNMLFLWLFGNSVCGRLGNGLYLLLFLICGLCSGAVFNLVDGGRLIGASGAIFGIIGFYAALYPRNRVRCLWYAFIRAGSTSIQGGWVILLFFLMDFAGLLKRSTRIAHEAHLAGVVVGFALALAGLKLDLINRSPNDPPSLLGLLTGSSPSRPATGTKYP